MPGLNKDTIRERKLAMGAATRVLKFLNTKLSSVFKVKLTNPPKDYTQDLSTVADEVRKLTKLVESKKDYTPDLQKGVDKIVGEVKKLDKEQKEVDLTKVVDSLGKVVTAVGSIKQPVFPKQPDGKANTKAIVKELKNLQTDVQSIPEPPKVVIPEFPKQVSVPGVSDVVKEIKTLQKLIGALPTSSPTVSVPDIDLKPLLDSLKDVKKAIKTAPKTVFPSTVDVGNFPPQMVPQPVTNININGLRGPARSIAKEVGASSALLPDTPLANRRTIMLFNNGAGTLWIGGDDSVTENDGLPVIAGSFSPPIDLSDRVNLYGISGAGTLDIRIFEVSMDDIGS